MADDARVAARAPLRLLVDTGRAAPALSRTRTRAHVRHRRRGLGARSSSTARRLTPVAGRARAPKRSPVSTSADPAPRAQSRSRCAPRSSAARTRSSRAAPSAQRAFARTRAFLGWTTANALCALPRAAQATRTRVPYRLRKARRRSACRHSGRSRPRSAWISSRLCAVLRPPGRPRRTRRGRQSDAT